MKINKKRELEIKDVKIEEVLLDNSRMQKKVILILTDNFSEYHISEGLISYKDDSRSIGLWLDVNNNEIDRKNRGIRELLALTDSETLGELIGKKVPVDNNDAGYLAVKLY